MPVKPKITRRERCYLVGLRGGMLNYSEAVTAWLSLCAKVEMLGEKDIPKFNDLLGAIRSATVTAKKRINL